MLPRTNHANGTAVPHHHAPWIRGVNLGGWLVTERWITPYLFAITDCHLRGETCFYPGQIDAPPESSPEYQLCPSTCQPVRELQRQDEPDYPIDEYTLTRAFGNKSLARQHMEYHWKYFVTKKDVRRIQQAGATHVRVPLGYWILGDIEPDEPWVEGGWDYFQRLVAWCRHYRLQVWPDLHAAPGSQNGFDNSGQSRPDGCRGWCRSPQNVQRTLDTIRDMCAAISAEEMTDVVTGFGVLNEPFEDCDETVVREFNRASLAIIRQTLGKEVAVFIGDMFHPGMWNNGYWLDRATYENTILDSHPYHVFFERGRAMTPREHIAYVCRKNHREVVGCCYEDFPANTVPSRGIQRMVGEWSASYDSLPTALIHTIMNVIATNGTAPFLDRQLSHARRGFLRNFVEAQMVTYEADVSRGWFFWNFKMEGGAFAEWDFLRGIDEGWIPAFPPSNVSSVDLYGTCEDIILVTNDSYSIVNEYPDPSTLDWTQWQGWSVDDDFVLGQEEETRNQRATKRLVAGAVLLCLFLLLVGFANGVVRRANRKQGYLQVP